MKCVLIAGATRYSGRHMVAKFKVNGWYVSALVRTTETAANVFSDAAEIIGADFRAMLTESSLIESFDRCGASEC